MEYLWIIAILIVAVLIFFLTRKKKKDIKDIDVQFEPVNDNGGLEEFLDDLDNWEGEGKYLLERSINFDLSEQANQMPFTVATHSGNRKKKQTEIILAHLRANGVIGITKQMAKDYYRIKNLSSQITKLRKSGYEIILVHDDYTKDDKPIGKTRYVMLSTV